MCSFNKQLAQSKAVLFIALLSAGCAMPIRADTNVGFSYTGQSATESNLRAVKILTQRVAALQIKMQSDLNNALIQEKLGWEQRLRLMKLIEERRLAENAEITLLTHILLGLAFLQLALQAFTGWILFRNRSHTCPPKPPPPQVRPAEAEGQNNELDQTKAKITHLDLDIKSGGAQPTQTDHNNSPPSPKTPQSTSLIQPTLEHFSTDNHMTQRTIEILNQADALETHYREILMAYSLQR